MGDVTELKTLTKLDLPPERILRRVAEKELAACVVIAEDKTGDIVVHSSRADGAEILWLLKRAERRLMEVCKI